MELKSYAETQYPSPLPLGRAIRDLPAQYAKILSRPGVTSFREEKGKASWGINWVQLIGLSIISVVLQTLGLLISPPALGSLASTSGMRAASRLK